MAVPEERQLLLQGGGDGRHAIEPPLLQIDDLLPVADVRVAEAGGRRVERVGGEVEELVHDRRQVEGREGRDLVRRAAEAGPSEEVRNVGGGGGQDFLLNGRYDPYRRKREENLNRRPGEPGCELGSPVMPRFQSPTPSGP